MYAYQSSTNSFHVRDDIVTPTYETIPVPTVDEDGNPVMGMFPQKDADGNYIMQDIVNPDGTTTQMPIMEHAQATHTEQRPVYPPLPDGYVDVSEEEHRALFEAQSEGKVIQPDPAGTGRPVALPPAPPTEAEQLAVAQASKRTAINTAHEAALAGAIALTDPTPSTVAVESALLAVQDAAGLEYVRDLLDQRRAELLALVDAAASVAAVAAIAVNYPV